MKIILALFLIVLVLTPGFALRSNTLKSVSNKQLQKLRNNKGTWASLMLDLAEMHAQTGGPLDQLVEAIEEVIQDLDNKLQKAHDDFDKRTTEHVAEVDRINKLISSAQSDIAQTAEFLEVLASQKQQWIVDIANTEIAIETNQRLTEEAIETRAAEKAAFEQKVPEHNEAIEAIEEALEVLSQLNDTGASFVQVKALKKSFSKFQNQIKKSEDKAFLSALMEVAASNQFADQSAIKRVAEIMNEVKTNLVKSLALLTEAEENAVAAHEEDLANKAAELARLSNELVEQREQLAITEQQIIDNEEFLVQRQADKVQFEQDLEDENEQYEQDTKAYEDLVAQLQNEQNACELALEHLNNSSFADYIGDRMEQDVIIDQPHGAGITVEENPFDLE